MTEAVPKSTASIAPLPANETERLAALQRYKILDTPPETAFDRITSMAARLFDVPTALVSLVDQSRVWIKSSYGFNQPEVSRDVAICSFALLSDDILVVLDAQQDDRFAHNPYVQSEPGLRFYAGAPLLTQSGFNLGTLCLLDTKPWAALTDEQKAILTDLAAIVVDELELRLAIVMQTAAEQERQQAEETLRQREIDISLITNAVPALISYIDADQCYRFNNRSYEEWFGHPASDIYGQPLWQVLGTAAYGAIRPYVEQVLAGQTATFETQVPYKDGGTRDVNATYIPQFNSQGNVQGFVALVSDITDRKQAEQALQEHSGRLNLLYETTSDLLSAKQPLDLMNHLFSQLSEQMDLHYYYHFQVSRQNGEQRLQLTHYSGISDEQAQSLESIELGEAMCGLVAQERRQIVLTQTEIATHPNAQGICSMGVSAYAGQPLIVQGRLLGTLSFASLTRTQFTAEETYLLQAISEQIAIAMERSELVASLQQQAEDLAQANRVKDEFLAVLSHELRSPLNPILGWTKLLQTGKFDAQKTKQALEIIERNAKQQTQLIDDLLDISRILRGKLALSEAPVDLVFTIEATLETVRLAAEAKNIQITTNFDSSIQPVLGDAGRLQQVVLNLLSNAIKFTPPNGSVEVRLEQVGMENEEVRMQKGVNSHFSTPNSPFSSYAQIQVIDTGRGIAPDFLPYVFESFRQEDGKITRKFGGLGLGLAIVRQLTELHGGTVRAESPGEGAGATFTIRLPLMQTQGLSLVLPQTNTSLSGVQTLQGVRVLVVDDEADMRDLVVTILEQAGAIVQMAASAAEALAVFDQFQPMLLVSDIGMPETNGYDFVQQVKSHSSSFGKPIPAIALTAYAMEQDHQQALAAGFQRHIAKPVEPEALVQEIVALINQREREFEIGCNNPQPEVGT